MCPRSPVTVKNRWKYDGIYGELKRQREWKNENAVFLRKVTRMLTGTAKIFRRTRLLYVCIGLKRGGWNRAGEVLCTTLERKIYLYETVAALSPAYDSREYRFRAERAAFN